MICIPEPLPAKKKNWRHDCRGSGRPNTIKPHHNRCDQIFKADYKESSPEAIGLLKNTLVENY